MSDPATKPPTFDGSGHRKRLRERLLADGDGLMDHEIVEYLLALAIPRRDTKGLAKQLLHEFGDLPTLFAADPAALARLSGMGDGATAAIKIVRAAALRMLKGEIVARPVLANWQALLDYLRADMAPLGTERVRLLLLNSKNELIRDEVLHDGTVDEAAVYVRQVAVRAMELHAAAVILVHNHPTH